MKSKIFLLVILLVLVGLININILEAQVIQEPVALVPVDLPVLPAPGLVPGDLFFFLDKWGEITREFFTFRAEDKARLQAERVLERTAEIKALLARDGVDSLYLVETEKRIQDNMARAARILERQKARGIAVSELSKELSDKFDARRVLLEEVFETTGQKLEAQEKDLRVQIREARQAGNFERIRELQVSLVNIRTQKERVDARKDHMEEILEIEKDKIEAKMEVREREIRKLAREARNLFNERKIDEKRIFEQKEKALELQEEFLGIQLEEALLAENPVLAEQIRSKLLNLEVQKKDIEIEKGTIEKSLDQKRERLKKVIAIEERAMEQIKEAREKLLDLKEEKVELIVDMVEIPATVLELISQVENKLVIAEKAFDEGNYGKAFGQAIAAEMLARNAERMLGKKDVETKPEIKPRITFCKIDADCDHLICPTAVGIDTPRCGPEGMCICGPGQNIDNNLLNERKDKERLEIEKIEDFFGVERLDERKIICIRECSVEIERAKDCVFDIIPENVGPEEIIEDIRLKTRLAKECWDEAISIRACLNRKGCYQLFVDKLKEISPEIHEAYKRLTPLLPALNDPAELPDPIIRPGDPIRICATVITPAINPQTGECRDFPDTCSVPDGWRRIGRCPR